MAVEHRHQRHQHQRINHEKHTVLHVVEGGDAERNRPGHSDTHRLAKIIRRVDDIAVRRKDVRQGINRHSATSSPGGSAGRRRCGRKVPRYCTAAPWRGRRSAAVSPAADPARRECACAVRRAPTGGLLRLRQLAVHRLLPRQNPGIAAGDVRREDLTQGIKDHRCIGIHRGVAGSFHGSRRRSVLLLTSASTAVAAVA